MFAFVRVCSRLLMFACVFASAFACVCQANFCQCLSISVNFRQFLTSLSQFQSVLSRSYKTKTQEFLTGLIPAGRWGEISPKNVQDRALLCPRSKRASSQKVSFLLNWKRNFLEPLDGPDRDTLEKYRHTALICTASMPSLGGK